MTPSTTFQWPPSPTGVFQPVRSLPLNSDVNPAGTALWASSRAPVMAAGTVTRMTRASAAADRHAVAFIGRLLFQVEPCASGKGHDAEIRFGFPSIRYTPSLLHRPTRAG